MNRIILGLLPLIAALAAAGCSGGSATLQGKVTYKRAVIRQGTVSVVDDRGFYASCPIGEDGTYKIEGCPTGKLKIGVSCPDPKEIEKMQNAVVDPNLPARGGAATGPKLSAAELKKLKENYLEIPASFGVPDDSGLTVTVSSGTNDHDIVIE